MCGYICTLWHYMVRYSVSSSAYYNYISGFGYFVVTPDTFRLHADDQPPSPWSTAWTHLHPMYIPAAFCQPQKAPMRSISCQVTEIEKPVIGQNESGDSTEFGLPSSNAIQVGIKGYIKREKGLGIFSSSLNLNMM